MKGTRPQVASADSPLPPFPADRHRKTMGAATIAYIVYKASMPVRLSITAVVVPVVGRMVGTEAPAAPTPPSDGDPKA